MSKARQTLSNAQAKAYADSLYGAIAANQGDEPGEKPRSYYAEFFLKAAKGLEQRFPATHIGKLIHPSSSPEATVLYLDTDCHEQDALTSRALRETPDIDTVGSATTLTMISILGKAKNGKQEPSLAQHLFRSSDACGDLKRVVLHLFDEDVAEASVKAWQSMIDNPSDAPPSNQYVKQVLWPVGDTHENSDYHALSILRSGVMIDAINKSIDMRDDYNANKEPRKSRDKQAYHETSVLSVPNVTQIKLGGANAQNVSNFNASRGGRCLQLPAFPPTWKSRNVRPVLGLKSALRLLSRNPEVLRGFRGIANVYRSWKRSEKVRGYRDDCIDSIMTEVVNLGVTLNEGLEAGWSKDPACVLSNHQKVWLDRDAYINKSTAERGLEFEPLFEFDADQIVPVWVDLLAGDVALWAEQQLRKQYGLNFDEDMAREVAKAFTEATLNIREVFYHA